jgi:hypothetical protein
LVGVSLAHIDVSARAAAVEANPDPASVRARAGAAAGGEDEIVVYGLADVRRDAANVQWALDNVSAGGTVRLAGLFHFSDYTKDGHLAFRPQHVHQPYAPWVAPHIVGLPMYYVPGTVQRYVVRDLPDPDDPTITVRYCVDPYFGAPLFPESPSMPKVPVTVYGADDRRVFITRDVRVVGDGARLLGGFWPFTVGLLPRLPSYDFFFDAILIFPWDTIRWDQVTGAVDPNRTLDVTIESIAFSDSWMQTIYCGASTNLTVRDNSFGAVRGFDLANWSLAPGQSFAGIHHPVAYPVLVGAAGAYTMPDVARDLITGRVTVSDNRFEGHAEEVAVSPATGPCPDGHVEQEVVVDHQTLATQTYCVPFGVNAQLRAFPVDGAPNVFGWSGSTVAVRLQLLSADVLVARNVVSGVSSIGLTCESNHGMSLITDNSVDLPGVPSGAEWFRSAIWVSDPKLTGSVGTSQAVVTRNTVVDRDPYTLDTLIADGLRHAVVSRNRIEMVDTPVTRTAIGVTSEDSSIIANQIFGAADLGVFVGASSAGTPAALNEFVGNLLPDVVGFTYLFLPETHSNTVKGYTGGVDSVLDLNPTGPYSALPNFISGVTPATPRGHSDALAVQRNEVADAARRTEQALTAVRSRYGRLGLPPRQQGAG